VTPGCKHQSLDARLAPDGAVCVYYLEIPRSKVVLLQTLFETYEGVATVRTLNSTSSVVSIMTTLSQRETCELILAESLPMLEWRPFSGIVDDPLMKELVID